LSLFAPSVAFARSSDSGAGFAFIAIGIAALIIFFFGYSNGEKDIFKRQKGEIDKEKKKSLDEVESHKINTTKEITLKKEELLAVGNTVELRITRFETFRPILEKDYKGAMKWLIDQYFQFERFVDVQKEKMLLEKKNPAKKANEAIKESNSEKREWIKKARENELILLELKELFPAIEEYLDEPESSELPPDLPPIPVDEDDDQAKSYLSKDEYERLSITDKYQLALDRYISRPHSKAEIGRFYERQIGYSYESKGYDVEYKGILDGFYDLGRDIIAEDEKEILIFQAKCWSSKKVIREKYIFNLYATAIHYGKTTKTRKAVKPVFVTTTEYSEVAIDVAKLLSVKLIHIPLDKTYPLIKCNINNGSYIYHLPFDQQYDRVKIKQNSGERYVCTIQQAENLGFRRAMRWFGN